MRINTKFPVAIHIMGVIATIGEDYSTSKKIALSVNTNPVVIRRINAMLKQANLITVNSSIGGTQLNRAPKDITLLDIYNAVKSAPEDTLFDLHSSPNPLCIVGANIHSALSEPFLSAQKALEDELGQYTLADILAKLPSLSEDELHRQRTMHLDEA